jgi:5'-nucleotidase/UDP-sugar diphosphatase
VIEDEIQAAKDAVDRLRNFEKVDLVIGLVHMGDKKIADEHVTSVELAQAVPGIDIIVDGFSHSYITEPIFTGHTYIVTAASLSRYIGYGRIVIKGGKLDSFNWKPIAVAPDFDVDDMLASYVILADEEFQETLGEAESGFDYGGRLPRYGETALGNLIADAASWYLENVTGLDIDFSLFNSGIIRDSINEGKITYKTIFSALPIENYLYIVSLKGRELLDLADEAAALPSGDAAFPFFSKELRVLVDPSSGSAITIGGAPIDPSRAYYFCVNSALLAGGVYETLTSAKEQAKTSLSLADALAAYIRAKEVISPEIDGRFTIVE